MPKEPTFAQELKSWRKKRRWLQKEAANFLGIPLDTYRPYEQGIRTPVNCLSLRELRSKMAQAV